MDNRPIGVFDSGLGGLTVLKELIRKMPNENFIYLGDTARVPYGTRSKEIIIKFALEDVNFLLTKNVKCVVVACNTVSALCAALLRKKIELPIFDIVSAGVDIVSKKFDQGNIAVIGTNATINSHMYSRLIHRKKIGIKVFEFPCPLLVPLAEEGGLEKKITEMIIRRYLLRFEKINMNALLLGCTHYPFFIKNFKNILGEKVKVINPSKIFADNIYKYLLKNNFSNNSKKKRRIFLFLSDVSDTTNELVKLFLDVNDAYNIKKVVF